MRLGVARPNTGEVAGRWGGAGRAGSGTPAAATVGRQGVARRRPRGGGRRGVSRGGGRRHREAEQQQLEAGAASGSSRGAGWRAAAGTASAFQGRGRAWPSGRARGGAAGARPDAQGSWERDQERGERSSGRGGYARGRAPTATESTRKKGQSKAQLTVVL